MSEDQKITTRLNDVEASMMHLQNDYDALNEVVLENVRRIEQLTKSIQGLTDRLKAASEGLPERKAEDERPPHY